MNEVIREYGGAILAAVSTFSLLWVLSDVFFSENGLFRTMIWLWGNGGC